MIIEVNNSHEYHGETNRKCIFSSKIPETYGAFWLEALYI